MNMNKHFQKEDIQMANITKLLNLLSYEEKINPNHNVVI